MRKEAILMLCCAIALTGSPARGAVEAGMTLKGGLRAPPPCTISDGGTLAIEFGDRVGINKVNDENYRQKVDYTIRCDSPGALPWEVVLMVKGTATAFDKTAVQTNKTDLGIRLYQNGASLLINSAIKVDPANPPRLEAMPVAKPGATLTEGAFSATATLQANYQ